jgi:Na+-translocating ferredoxin:NAD+ oxidoreductase RnfD subunit
MDPHSRDVRLPALRRFALAITALNVLGHTVFGFEQAWAQPLVALLTAYSLDLGLEYVDARLNHRPLRFTRHWRSVVDFLLSAHITGLAVAMLLYANEELAPIAFATAVATGSKVLFRVRVGSSMRHVFNPSNFGIATTLALFPWVGIAPPYHFSENLPGLGQWLLPAVIVASGSLLNIRMTRKVPLILGWVGGFVVQAGFRSLIFGNSFIASVLPLTGVAFLLFTFYMITDPATTPAAPPAQVVFGLAVAAAYGVLLSVHIVFGLFFALALVCALRAVGLSLQSIVAATRTRVSAVTMRPTSVVEMPKV